MRISLKEMREQLALARTLPAEAKVAMIKTLQAAEVFDVNEKNEQVPVRVEIEVPEPIAKANADAAQKGQPAVDPATLQKLAAEEVQKQLEAARKAVQANMPQPGLARWAPPSGVKHYVPKNFRGEINGRSAQERAFRFGQFALALLGNETAKAFCESAGIQLKLHQGNVNTSGGYLVPEEFGTDLIDLREQYGVVRKLFKVRQMSSDTRTDPRRVSGLTAYFVAEGGAGTESTKGWDQVRLTAKDLMVLSRMTNQLNQDSVINIGDDLAQEIAYAFTLKEDQCGFLGDGTSTYGGIVGVSSRLSTVNGVDEGGGIILASGNLFSEFTLSDFNRVVARLPQYADTPQACWVAHRSFYFGTMQRLELASGGVTAVEVREGNRTPMFLGYRVQIAQVMPSADANSQIATTFGDHSLAASFGDRQQDTIMFSEHATVGGESVFERNEIAVRGTERIDINVHDVGTSTAAGPVVGLMAAAG